MFVSVLIVFCFDIALFFMHASHFHMNRFQNFSQISKNPDVVKRLSYAYEHVDDIDLLIGGLAEDHLPGK